MMNQKLVALCITCLFAGYITLNTWVPAHASQGGDEEAWQAFEAHFDGILLRERLVTAVLTDPEIEDITLSFMPSLLHSGIDLQDPDNKQVFMGVIRIESTQIDIGNGEWLAVGLEAKSADAHDWILLDHKGQVVLVAPGEGEPVPGFVGESDAIPLDIKPRDPIQKSGPRPPGFSSFDPDAPKVFALIHGRTMAPESHPERRIGQVEHAYTYWGFDFITELLGVPGADHLLTFDDSLADATSIRREEWAVAGIRLDVLEQMKWLRFEIRGSIILEIMLAQSAAALITLCLLGNMPACFAGYAASAALALAYLRRHNLEKELAALYAEPGVRLVQYLTHEDRIVVDPASGKEIPERVVMLTHRNGSETLGDQAKALTQQLSGWYRHLRDSIYPDPSFGAPEPVLCFIAHSMGGLVSRYVLTRPENAFAGPGLDAGEIELADELAERTVALVTLQTLHEGTVAADEAMNLSTSMSTGIADVVFRLKDIMEPNIRALAFSPMRVFDGITGADLPATEHLRTEHWTEWNTGPLAPHLMSRPDGSLIPVYPLASRSPAAGRLNTPDPDPNGAWAAIFPALGNSWVSNFAMLLYRETTAARGLMDIYKTYGSIAAKETFGLMTSDGAMDFIRADGWGDDPYPGPDVPGAPERRLDTMRRIRVLGIPSNPIIPSHYVYPDRDLEEDNDGLLATATGFGVHLSTPERDYFSCGQRWEIEPDVWVTGSWYRQYFSGERFLDYSNHTTMMKDQRAGEWLRTEILDQAGPYVRLSASGWCDEISQWKPE